MDITSSIQNQFLVKKLYVLESLNSVTTTEIDHLHGSRANIQAQLDGKAPASGPPTGNFTTPVHVGNFSESNRDLLSSPTAGTIIFQTDDIAGLRCYDGSSWASFLTDGQLALATIPYLTSTHQEITPTDTYTGIGTATAVVNTRIINADTPGAFALIKPGDDIVLFDGEQYSVVDRITTSQVRVFERISNNRTNVVYTVYPTALNVRDVLGAVLGSSLKNDGSLLLHVHSTTEGNLASIQFADQENSWKIECGNLGGVKNLQFRCTVGPTGNNPNPFVVDKPNNDATYEALRILANGIVKTLYGFASFKNNTSGLTSISTGGGSPLTFTNAQGFNVMVFIGGGVVSALSVNGTTVATGVSVTGLLTVPLQPGESLIVTYSSAPIMNWKAV